jgi:glycosyltransferase involved in cell wall biosynthesis
MNILFANNICGYYGGVEQVILHTARGLTARGHRCSLAYSVTERNPEEFVKAFADTFPCNEFACPQPQPTGELFPRILERARPDVVFFHKVTQLPPNAEHTPGVRMVRMVHDMDLFCPSGLGYFRHSRRVCHHRAGWCCWLDLAFLARASSSRVPVRLVGIGRKLREMRRNHHIGTVLAVSGFIRNKLVANGFPEDQVHVCHPILDVANPLPTPVPGEPRILFVGALLRGKGVDLLLRALREVSCAYTATIVGAGPLEHKLKALCGKLGLNRRVTFAGWVAPKETAWYYSEAKVVAIPSCWPEPFTLVGQESMRYGRPVVAFDVGGNTDWLEHDVTGVLVPEQDVRAFARALERLLTDTAYAARLGANAARRVRERFPFAGYLDQVEAYLLGKTPGRV